MKASNVQASAKASWRSSAEKILRRTGKIFRSAIRISSYDIIVSVYALGFLPDGTISNDHSVIMNFYSSKCSEATEIQIPQSVQIEYVGDTFLNVPVGEKRADLIREFCKFLQAEITEDAGDSSIHVLEVDLITKKKESEEENNNNLNLETIGKIIYRQKNLLVVETIIDKSKSTSDLIEYLITLSNYSIGEYDGPEKGVLTRINNPATNQTLYLLYNANDILNLCNKNNEPDLLRDLYTSKEYLKHLNENKELFNDFVTEIEKVELASKIKTGSSIISDFIVKDLKVKVLENGKQILFSKMNEELNPT